MTDFFIFYQSKNTVIIIPAQSETAIKNPDAVLMIRIGPSLSFHPPDYK